jgi:hypothetical protein
MRRVILFDFNSVAECSLWNPINDVVMGGDSHSRFDYVEGSRAVFAGTVSLKNFGGFASIRSTPSLYDLREYVGLLLRVRGDGKLYKLNLKTDGNFDGITYQATFEPLNGKWKELQIPFLEFVPMFRGARVHYAAPLDATSICSFGFLISCEQECTFHMDIDWICAYQ